MMQLSKGLPYDVKSDDVFESIDRLTELNFITKDEMGNLLLNDVES